MDTKMRDRFQQRLSPQLFSSGKNIDIVTIELPVSDSLVLLIIYII